MKPFAEFEGKNVDSAVQNACTELNIEKDQLKYDVISSGSSGIFGLVGFKKARIRVKLPQQKPPHKEKKADDQAKQVLDISKEGVMSLVDEAFGEPAKKEPDAPAAKPEKKEISVSEGPVIQGKEILQQIVDQITSGATITAELTPEGILYSITGGNSAVLIGKRGQTLEAMQYLADKIVNKKSDQRLRVQVDVEGYLESRRETLRSLATRLAEKVKRTGKPATIGQMTAHDRRIVHLELKDDKAVRTQSVGDGYYRRLVIFPKKRNYRKKKNKAAAKS